MIRKQPYQPNDYEQAHKIAHTMTGGSQLVTVANVKAFRKYISDLGGKQGKQFYTRRQGDNTLLVGLIR